MGSRAYLARSGWRETPITAAEWRDAAHLTPELEVHHLQDHQPVFAVLRGSRHSRLTWHDGYILAQHTNPRFVAVLFALAERMGAQVYSERRRPYLSVADWQQRQRRAYRGQVERHRPVAASHPAFQSRRNDWLTFLALLVTLVLFARWAFGT